jgi:hypothetical protein
MPTKTDPMVAETARVYAEYDQALAGHEADPADPFARARFDRAQVAVRDTRKTWREIGEAAGTRGDTVVATVDNEAAPVALIPAQEA